jgi:hypothetical protein
MHKEIWTLHAILAVHVFLVYEDISSVKKPIHPAVRKLIIQPIFDENNKQANRFSIDIDFEITSTEDKIDGIKPYYLGIDILQYYINLLTFLSGDPVFLPSEPYVSFYYPGTKKSRQIRKQKAVAVHPPYPLIQTNLFKENIDPKISKVLSWLRKGIEEKDIISSASSMFISLELLSTLFECTEKRIRKCERCKLKTELLPGTAERIKCLLIQHLDFNIEKYEKVWHARNKLMHGGISLSAEEIIEIDDIKQAVYLIVIKGLKKLLNIPHDDPPQEIIPPFNPNIVLLDLELEEKS